MANSPPDFDEPWLANALRIFIVVLVVVHVLALAFWIYKLTTDHKQRTKPH